MKKETKTTKKEEQNAKNMSWLAPVLGLAILIFAAWSFYSYLQIKGRLDSLSSAEGQQAFQEAEAQKAARVLSKHMLVPLDEIPSVVVISDVELLIQEQPFFEGSLDGDQLFVYPEFGQAIIYRPSVDRIVKVGPVSFDNQGQATNNVQRSVASPESPSVSTEASSDEIEE